MDVEQRQATFIQSYSPDFLSERTCRIALIVIVAIGAMLRLWGLQFGLPHTLARPDEEVVVGTALGLLQDPNPHHFDWPTFFMYVTAAAYAVFFGMERVLGAATTDPRVLTAGIEPTLHLIARALSASAGIMTIAVLYRAATELFSRRAALVAAALLAIAYLHVRDSHFGVTDVPVTFLTVCAFWAGIRCATKGLTDSRVAVAGLLCGLAASTKYNAAVVLLPAVAAIARASMSPERRSAVVAVRAGSILLACSVFGFLMGTPFALLDWPTFSAGFIAQRLHLFGGHVVGARGWRYHAMLTLPYGLGLPLLITALLGACWLVVTQPWKAVLALSFPLAYYAGIGAGMTVFARYMVPMVPFLCLTAGVLVDGVARTGGRLLGTERARNISLAALFALIAIPAATLSLRFDRLLTQTDTRLLGASWIESRFPNGASIYQTGFNYGQLQPHPAGRFVRYGFNEETGRFDWDGTPVPGLPDVIVHLDSPLLAYSPFPGRLTATLNASYVLAMTFEGTPKSRVSNTFYDQEDAFFIPLGGLENTKRPGPNVRIYELRPFDLRPGLR